MGPRGGSSWRDASGRAGDAAGVAGHPTPGRWSSNWLATRRSIEVVTIRQLRRRRIARAGETRVEFSLDEVDVVVVGSGVVERFVEFEAELVKGDDGLLAALAVVLDGDPGLASEQASKLQTAMAAVRRGAGMSVDDHAGGNGAGLGAGRIGCERGPGSG